MTVTLSDRARKLLHLTPTETWTPANLSTNTFCWVCTPEAPVRDGVCADCHVRIAATAYREASADFHRIDRVDGQRSDRDTTEGRLDQWS